MTTLFALYCYKGCETLTKFLFSTGDLFLTILRLYSTLIICPSSAFNATKLFLYFPSHCPVSALLSPLLFLFLFPHHLLFNYLYPTVSECDQQRPVYSVSKEMAKWRVPCSLPWREVQRVGLSTVCARTSKRRCQIARCRDAVRTIKTQAASGRFWISVPRQCGPPRAPHAAD